MRPRKLVNIKPFEYELRRILYWRQENNLRYFMIDPRKNHSATQIYEEHRFVPRNTQNDA